MTRFPELPGIVPLGLKDFLPLTAPVLGQSGPLRNAASIRTGHCLDWLCTGRRANHPGGCEPCHECHKSQVNLFGLEKRMFQSNVGIYKQPVRGMNEFLGTVHWVLFDFLLWVLRASVAKACHTHHPVAMDLLWACFGISCRRKCSKWIKWQLNERSVARKHAPVFCLAASQLPATMFWSHHWPLRNSNFDQSSSDLAASNLVYCCHNPESPGSSAGPVAWCPGDPNQQFGKRGKNDRNVTGSCNQLCTIGWIDLQN